MYRPPVIQGLIGAAAGVGSGLLRSFDTDEWEKNPKNTKGTPVPPLDFGTNHTLWEGLGLLVLGVGATAFGWPHRDAADGLVVAGSLLTGQEIATGVAQGGNPGYISAPVANAGAQIGGQTAHRVQPPVAVAAYREVSATGLI